MPFLQSWSVKAEYQHFDFGKEQSLLHKNSCETDVCRFDHKLTVDTVEGRVSTTTSATATNL